MNITSLLDYVRDGQPDLPITHVRARAAALADVGPATIHAWQKTGAIPIEKQALIELRTGGILKANDPWGAYTE